MAKARHTNKGGRNLPTESPTEAEDAQEWVTPDTTQFPQPVMLMQVYDYGEGKTREQEEQDSVAMLGSVLAAVLVIIAICVIIAVVAAVT